MLEKQIKKSRRKKRLRAKIFGTSQKPRLNVFRSAKHIYGQIINDTQGVTLASVSDFEIKETDKKTKTEIAQEVGKILAQKTIKKNIQTVVFDRNGYKYHGRVKALAEGARAEGLRF